MSKANIISQEKLPNGKVEVVFDTATGPMKYLYSGSSARALLRGSDPGQLAGKRIEERKKK